MEYRVIDHIGPRAIIREDGQKVFDTIYPVLKTGESAKLDFDGVSQFASPFFNFAIGQLLKDLTVDDLKQKMVLFNSK